MANLAVCSRYLYGMDTYIKYIIFFSASFVFSVLINKILLTFSTNLGVRNKQLGLIRWDSFQKPSLGGISFYILFLLSVIAYPMIVKNDFTFIDMSFIGIISATSIGFLMGLADDAYNTKPFLKFFTQVLCGVILIVSGTYIHLFENTILNYIVTIFWVVGIMNSLNMLDNMDAVTTVVSLGVMLSILSVLFFFKLVEGVYFAMSLGVVASLGGFLIFNWHPSKMYMGDTGSQFLGILLAALGIKFLWNAPIEENSFSIKHFVLVVVAFLPTLVDTTTVTINRLARKRSPFVGGKDHTTHFLSYLGLSDTKVASLFLILSLISSALVALGYFYIQEWKLIHTCIYLFYAIVIFVALFSITKLKSTNKKYLNRLRK